jgi:dipeptidyl-peptidase-4
MRYLFILFSFVIFQELDAQKKNFTMQEAVLGLNTTLAVKNLKQLKWMGSTEKVAQAISTDEFKGFVATHPKRWTVDTVVDLNEINGVIAPKGLAVLKQLPAVEWISENEFYFQKDSNLIFLKRNTDGLFEVSKLWAMVNGAENMEYAPDHGCVAYTAKHNIYLQSGPTPTAITTDGDANLLYGTKVHREEFGIDRGLFWSPKGNALTFYRMDQTMVADYPIVNWLETPATVKMIKYPMAGKTSHQVQVWVHHRSTGKNILLETTGPKDQYLTNISWSLNEAYVFIQIVNRAQNKMTLNQYDAVTGKFVRTILDEEHNAYVEPQHPLYFLNDNEFIYWSQREGFWHLYKHSLNNDQVMQITKGNWLVNEILGFNKKTNELIISSSEGGAMEKNIYAIDVTQGNRERVCLTPGTHTAQVSAQGNYIIDVYSSHTIPRKIDLVEVESGKAKNLLSADNPLSSYQTARVEVKELRADDGTTLYGKLMYPANFNEVKKYPVIVYVYNGPHVQLNKNNFPESGNLWYDYLTQRGYIVFVLDGRGSSNRGFAFESAIHRQLGTIEMQDQLVGINYLKTLPFVDAKRMGMHGWSYGGFMTTSFMLRQPEVFVCGVAGGPVLDWSMYEIMYGERYMGTPENNPTGYKNNLLLDKIKNLKGKLLLIHGTDDPTVVWQHSIAMLKQAVTDNIQVDYFVYPGYEHNVRGKDRVHLMQKVTDYFDTYLKPE